MILNARLETLQQDEVLTRFEQLPSLPPGCASFKDLDFWCLKIKVPHISSHGNPWPSYPFQYIKNKLPLKAVGSSWHSPKYVGIPGTSFIIRNKEKPQLQPPLFSNASVRSDGAHQFLSDSLVLVLGAIWPRKLGANLSCFSVTSPKLSYHYGEACWKVPWQWLTLNALEDGITWGWCVVRASTYSLIHVIYYFSK